MVRLPLRSPLVAAWLFVAALLVVVMVCVGGATRLTESGLSITEWKPVTGALPPMNAAAWQAAFDGYRKIPQYRVMNAHMTLEQFKGIYWWEWSHRFLARLVGLVYLGGFVAFLLMKAIPARLIWRCGVLVGLIALQAVVGWYMVKSGLQYRTEVAPEMLTLHLFMALLLLIGSVWTGLEALEGQKRGRGAPDGWKAATGVMVGLVFLQCLLGALVAGNRAGLVYNDWPMMNGALFPPVEWAKGIGYSFLHDQGLVQFVHRMNAYLVLVFVTAYGFVISRKTQDDGLKTLGAVVAFTAWVQVALGVTTLLTVVATGFALAHQLVAVILMVLTVILMWRIARADRVFR